MKISIILSEFPKTFTKEQKNNILQKLVEFLETINCIKMIHIDTEYNKFEATDRKLNLKDQQLTLWP